jgi:hypothetical protein
LKGMTMRILLSLLALSLSLQSAGAEAPREISANSPLGIGGYSLTPALTIGGPDAIDEAQFYEKFGQVRMDAAANGDIYVLDSGNIRVQIFDKSGAPKQSIGAEGEGPGEFKMPSRMSVNSEGSVAVFDMATQRITVFAPDGAVTRDQIVQRPVVELLLLDSGELLCAYMPMGGPLIERFDVAGESVWTHGESEAPKGGNFMSIEMGEQGARRLGSAGKTIILASRDEYGINVVNAKGPGLVLNRPFERMAVKMPERDEDDEDGEVVMVMISQDGGDGGAHGGGGSSFTAQSGDGEEMTINMDDLAGMMPKFGADIRGTIVFKDGRIWALTSELDGDRMLVDEWSSTGDYRMQFSLSSEYGWLELGADGQLYGLSYDEDDYPLVHRLDIATLE